ncbi:MAG TPA: hypothetical protein VJP87_11355 [Candidatus Acidoferrales bacterium]|nr:hypothetical protein [Candidatus Acidoferrales bacterium]
MAKKATASDAELLMRLYDLRREAEMRKARDWWLTKFWPNSAEDFMRIAWAMGTQENNWLRQVGAYWGMAAGFVKSGLINVDLFLQPANSGEMFFVFAKVQPFLKELRKELGDPEVFRNVEEVIHSTKYGRERIAFIAKRVAGMKEKMAGAR